MARGKELRLTFGTAAGDYERGRPGYPDDAVDWILGHVTPVSDGIDVADVGAGTGKFTRSLVSRDLRVTAAEPDPIMRATLSENLPSVSAVDGSGESIPAPDASFDLVTFAQAWHWVDVDLASREVARVLRPEGVLALVWNIRDEEVDWVQQLGEIMGSSAAEEFDNVRPPVSSPLVRREFAEFRWENTIGREELLAMVTSRSYIIALSEDDREALLRDVDRLLDGHPDLAGHTEFTVPYLTRVTIASLG
jgi:SAM-dependent methyltransferase